MGRNGKYRIRTRYALPEPAPAFGIEVRLDRMHRVAMPEEYRRHHLFHPFIRCFGYDVLKRIEI